ncbi:MAG: integrase [Candidatus Methanomethyliaceae archaeon]
MPRKGYKSITVPEDLYRKLLELAERYGTTPQNIIKIAVSDDKFSLLPPGALVISGSNPDGPTMEPSFLKEKKLHQEKSFFNNREIGTVQSTVHLEKFKKFCRVDLGLSQRTTNYYFWCVRKFLSRYSFTNEEIRDFLVSIENSYTFNNWLKAFTAYARFLNVPIKFKFKRVDPPIRTLPTKSQLREFYSALDTDYERLAFIGFCVTGLRRGELLNLKLSEINMENRAIIPNHSSLTKRSFITFYNEEFEEELSVWLKLRSPKSERLFTVSGGALSCLFRLAQLRTGLHITPQTLRFWFANEMARLGVPDRFIDAFQGRIPRSVLARHYTDYSLENLKAIYDKAGLKVLS